MLSSTQLQSRGYLACHLASHWAMPRRAEIAPVVKPAQFLQAVVIDPARHVIERVPQKMHVAALPGGLREHFTNRRLQPLMMVGDDKLDAGETARLQPGEELAPARPALAVGKLDREDLPPTVLVDRHRNQHGLADDDPGLAHLLVARVKDQVG